MQMYRLEQMQRELSLNFQRNDKLGHFEQFCRTCVYFHFQFTYIVLSNFFKVFCENSMRAYPALVLKDTFTPRFLSIQSILDSVDYEVILA